MTLHLLYLQTTNFVVRRQLISVLMYVGGDDTFELFKYSLFEEFNGRHLKHSWPDYPDEETVQESIVNAMAWMAQTNDAVYNFLKEGANPWFWKGRITWVSDSPDDLVGRLVSASITAVGQTGRKDALDILRSLRRGALSNPTDGSGQGRDWIGDFLQAAWLNDVTRAQGVRPKIPDTIPAAVNINAMLNEYQRWHLTENGREWDRWAEEAKKTLPSALLRP